MMGESTDEAFAAPLAKCGFMAERVLVVGGGTMGAGIALVAATAGCDVEIVEPQSGARERALAEIEREAQRSGDPSIAQRIAWLDAIPAHSDARLAIEAVPERYDLKCEVFAALSTALASDALLATNTSSLSVTELADVASNPQRVLGLHFFNPPLRMALVEVVAAPQTGDDAIERAFEIVERFGKSAVLTSDTPGFIVNRVARPYYLQSLRALEREVASAPELDALARAAGFRMGPFELMDLIGLDVNLATSESLYARTEAERFEPVALQREMVADGLLGRKSGAGFYTYRDGRAERFEISVPPADGHLIGDEIVAVVGFGNLAHEMMELLEQQYRNVQHIGNDDLLDELSVETTIVVDASDGAADRGEVVAALDTLLGPQCVLFADAYATDLGACAKRMRHPERLVGYGLLGSLTAQRAVEIVNAETVSDDALELAQELFESIGVGSVLVEDVPGLFLGRTVGSIVNEAMIAVAEQVASPEDVDAAMRLGANYPIGPIAWGREIGGARLSRILKRLAEAEGEQFAPHRSLWVLDLEESAQAEESARAEQSAQ
jgi:3-hydroxybutyryl-CoA dehydrogenase